MVGFVIESSDFSLSQIEDYYNHIRGGGVDVDGIPPIEIPQYLNVSQANYLLEDWDVVIGVNYNGKIVAYPQNILVHHEIVNDRFGNERVSITYCPLTASSVGFIGEIEGTNRTYETTFGVSGKLLNSNLVTYDRETNSYWPQILGRSIRGNELGLKLETIQTYWTTWDLWRTKYPDTLVLSQKTGHIRNYNVDPYGTYEPNSSSYYQTGPNAFTVMHESDFLPHKEMIIGIDYNNIRVSIQKSFLEFKKAVNVQIIENESIATFFDESLQTANVFSGQLNDINLIFKYENGQILDQFGKEWYSNGSSLSYNENLKPIVSLEAFWFSWYAYFPQSLLLSFLN